MKNTVYGVFREAVERHGSEPAIIEEQRTLTFAELSDMVDRIASGIPEGTKAVGIVMEHRAEMIASMLAVLKTGAMFIPAEPTFPIGRIRYMMDEGASGSLFLRRRCRRIYPYCK